MQTNSAGRADGPPLIFHVDLSQGPKVTGARPADRHMFYKLQRKRDMLSNEDGIFPALP